MNREQLYQLTQELTQHLLSMRNADGMWRGHLSSSAISTSVSVFALYLIDKDSYHVQIEQGASWLLNTMKADGTWGDSEQSPSNMTATLLSFAALYALGKAPQQTSQYLRSTLGYTSEDSIISGVLRYYGRDLTFSVPILSMCGLAGIISDWSKIPQFPFELSVLPQRFYKFLQLPVVSYAIPALIAVGILRMRRGRKGLFTSLREQAVPACLRVLTRLQPSDGGFLEAAPLTAFVAMCMCGSGLKEHPVTQRAADFLTTHIREDGSWPIDTDLAQWVTSLSIRALGDDLADKGFCIDLLKRNAQREIHPFTGAQPGGWGWTNLSGSVPDADDTAGALVALHVLTDGTYCEEAEKGIIWLLDLQNSDGGIPTFCKGWTRLPFDQSSPDLTAHAIKAFTLWHDSLPDDLRRRSEKGLHRMVRFLQKNQTAEGAWIPLWFGNQDAKDEHSPVYGTATAVDYLSAIEGEDVRLMRQKGIDFLLRQQKADGGWDDGVKGPSKVTLTARTLTALASYADTDPSVLQRGFDFLYQRHQESRLYQREPIGLYFARLWYSEDLYNVTFSLSAMKQLKRYFKW